ncbi:choline transporter-like protein 2 isoform X2 [Dunckerocampus dactyliophorus]|uniref:choline transporter-like protein 2 isoform X2 n=1 Tax=Dunckerocampus dactyliophorus TaxID=161453 RepID=UPI0024058CCD|nr:choline transporter-like protein 2 isoform X2 [Dunckerocampus dactyliophorus]
MELEEKPKFGEPRKYDPTFKGPIHNRGCTDIVCCIIFILAILAYIAVGILAWSQGDPRKVIYPTDSEGQFCGQGKLKNKTLLFYFNIMKCASPMVLLAFQCPTTQICVEKCPTKFMTLTSAFTSEFDDYRPFCKESLDITQLATPVELLKSGVCPGILIPSTPVFRRCLPTLAKKNGQITVGDKNTFKDENEKDINAEDLVPAVKNASMVLESRQVFMKIFEDYTQSWYWILLCLVMATVLSLVFIIVLRFLAGIMVWVMIALLILVIGYGIFHCYMEYARREGQAGADVTLQELGLQADFTIYFQIRQTWLAFMIILAIVEVIIILLLIFLRKRILIAIALIKEASKAIGYVMCSLFYPLFTFLLLAVVIAYWAVTAVFLSTSNEPVYKVVNKTACTHSMTTCNPDNYNTTDMFKECPFSECLFAYYGGDTVYHKYLIGLQFYNVFLLFWCVNFVIALGQMTLAGAFASYYWAFVKPDDIPAFPIFSALGRALRYHTGTLAFGSLILAIVQVIRVLLEYLDHKLKGTQNKFTKFLLCCLKCCFWCLEKFIKFLNRNAYIMVAIYGKNFCTSARDAFFLLMRNIVRVAVLNKVTDFLLLLGKLLVVGLVGVFAFFFFSGRVKAFEDTAPNLHYYWVSIVTAMVGSFLIAHGFFSVYSMCVDTLFLCFCEDLERNDGSPSRPYYISPTLAEILLKNKADKTEDPSASQDEDDITLQQQQAKEEDIILVDESSVDKNASVD